ncbi:hypothetical protein [Mesorhizobium sp. B1-1-8]|uniref:hypothetical protein n=1 Tax=Mesorhizobium sp. B1-1-8 TaxID=2589976 RepID=UPI00112D3475|nr:hypothetical protein [Mesorhizobium sp. B1-1-8]UCI07337.1 hypothetical protein FJ974_26725 [Mesorhizobium sp. B1-1-8]
MKIIERFSPDAVILEEMEMADSCRSPRLRTINGYLAAYIEGYGLPLYRYSPTQVRTTFSYLPQVTKGAIAVEIARLTPAFLRLVPRRRRAWMSESARMGLFDAASLVITHYRVELGGQDLQPTP